MIFQKLQGGFFPHLLKGKHERTTVGYTTLKEANALIFRNFHGGGFFRVFWGANMKVLQLQISICVSMF